jgi:hypothetical protein
MNTSKIIQLFSDVQEKRNNEISFFFLEHVLKARADLHMESGKHEYDQEINVYLAGLLNSLMDSETFLKPYISPFDLQVRQYLDNHPGLRNEYTVYRDNADFGLIILGFFLGYEHKGSYQNIVLSEVDEKSRISLYYEQAASALSHLQGRNLSLVTVFEELAEYLPDIIRILRHAASSYFNLVLQISEGTFYHLEKEMNQGDNKRIYSLKLDEFLKKYAAYKENPTQELKKNIMDLAEELRALNEKFTFGEF